MRSGFRRGALALDSGGKSKEAALRAASVRLRRRTAAVVALRRFKLGSGRHQRQIRHEPERPRHRRPQDPTRHRITSFRLLNDTCRLPWFARSEKLRIRKLVSGRVSCPTRATSKPKAPLSSGSAEQPRAARFLRSPASVADEMQYAAMDVEKELKDLKRRIDLAETRLSQIEGQFGSVSGQLKASRARRGGRRICASQGRVVKGSSARRHSTTSSLRRARMTARSGARSHGSAWSRAVG